MLRRASQIAKRRTGSCNLAFVAESQAPGLRVQIVLALAGAMLLAFVPLFFAVASLTRATLQHAHDQTMRALGRTIAAHVADVAAARDMVRLRAVLDSHVGPQGALAIVVLDANGSAVSAVGETAELATLSRTAPPFREDAIASRSKRGPALDVMVPRDGGVTIVRLRADDQADRAAPLVQLVGLYMTTFAIALLFFAYFMLTRLIVRPLDKLVRAAERVARGGRSLEAPEAGARELLELGAAVQAMTTKLLSEERALRDKVAEVTNTSRRLLDAQSQLAGSERLASVGRLAAGLAHEIGNPITAIMGMEDLLLEGGLSDREQRDFLSRMKRETERIHVVLRDLLDYARTEPESDSKLPAPADVPSVVRDVFALAQPQKHFRGVELVFDATPRTVLVKMSAQRLTQVLLNLVMNAGAAMATSDKAPRRIVIRVHDEGPLARIDVEDTGPGVSAELGARIFDPFVTTKDVGEGTGLGLAVCKGIAESAGGSIVWDTEYKEGARFILRVPRAS